MASEAASAGVGSRPGGGVSGERGGQEYRAEELADARLLSRAAVLGVVESLTLAFLRDIARGDDPQLHLVL